MYVGETDLRVINAREKKREKKKRKEKKAFSVVPKASP